VVFHPFCNTSVSFSRKASSIISSPSNLRAPCFNKAGSSSWGSFFHFAVHTYSFVPLYCLQTILTSSLLSPISSYPHSRFLGRISFVVLSSSPFFLGSAYIAVGSGRRACGLREGVASVLVGVEGHRVERVRGLYKGLERQAVSKQYEREVLHKETYLHSTMRTPRSSS
jgi:hypothetical protein